MREMIRGIADERRAARVLDDRDRQPLRDFVTAIRTDAVRQPVQTASPSPSARGARGDRGAPPGVRLEWDADAMRFTNNDAANAMVTQYRNGYALRVDRVCCPGQRNAKRGGKTITTSVAHAE
jgi:hypothetical protein